MGLDWLHGVMCYFHRNNQTRLADYRQHYHKIHAGKLSPNGGKIEMGETSEIATIRESLEETGTLVRKLVYRGKVHFNNEKRTVQGKPMKFNMVVDVWSCYDFEEGKVPEGQAPVIWVDDSNMLELALHEGDKRVWEWMQRHVRFEGIVTQIGEKLDEENTKIVSYDPRPL